MATIKAGTYRFNDVLTQSTNYTVEGAILFNSSVNGETITCNGIYDRSLDDWLTLAYSVYITELGDYMEANVYNDGWYTDDFGDGIKTITIPSDSEVSDEFYAWFTANAVSQGADVSTTTVITYKGSTIATLEGGKTATLKCKGMKMESDVVVKAAEQTESTPPNIQPLTITENGTYTPPEGVDGYSPIAVEVVAGGCGDTENTLDAFIEGSLTEVVLPTATKIRNYAFYENRDIRNIEMPKVTSIGNNAFYNCSNLALTSLPSGVTSISHSAFYNCSNLALTSLPSGVTSIGGYAFFGCSSLKTITFEGKPTRIENNAFGVCSNLITINVPWAEGAVANAPWGATNATINYNYGSTPSLISFTIGGTSYTAESGMTWAEWVESDYNTGDAFRGYQGYIVKSSNVKYLVSLNGTDVLGDDYIQASEYTTIYVGGAGGSD